MVTFLDLFSVMWSCWCPLLSLLSTITQYDDNDQTLLYVKAKTNQSWPNYVSGLLDSKKELLLGFVLWIFSFFNKMKTGNHIFILNISIASIASICFIFPTSIFWLQGGTNAKKKEYNIITSCSYVQTWKTLQTWIFQVFLPPAQVHNADRGKNVAEFGIKWPGQATLICYWICVNMTRISRRHKTWKQCFNI